MVVFIIVIGSAFLLPFVIRCHSLNRFFLINSDKKYTNLFVYTYYFISFAVLIHNIYYTML